MIGVTLFKKKCAAPGLCQFTGRFSSIFIHFPTLTSPSFLQALLQPPKDRKGGYYRYIHHKLLVIVVVNQLSCLGGPPCINGHFRYRLIGGTYHIYKASASAKFQGIYPQNMDLYGIVPPVYGSEISIDCIIGIILMGYMPSIQQIDKKTNPTDACQVKPQAQKFKYRTRLYIYIQLHLRSGFDFLSSGQGQH